MKFIKLTKIDTNWLTKEETSATFNINPNKITYFGVYEGEKHTSLSVGEGDFPFIVLETPEEIMSLIKATGNDLQRY